MKQFQFRFARAAGVVIAAAFLVSAQPCHARDSLAVELTKLALSAKQFLALTDSDSIAVGDFTGPAGTKYGPRIVETLKAALEAQHVRISRRGIAIKGEYRLDEVEDPANPNLRVPIVRITGKFVDGDGAPLNTVTIEAEDRRDQMPVVDGGFSLLLKDQDSDKGLPDVQAIVEAGGKSGCVPASLHNPADRARAIGDLQTKVALANSGTRIFACSRSKVYGAELLVNGTPVKFEIDADGAPCATVSKGDKCELRILNNSRHDAAVRVTVDGLSVFQFSKVRHKSGRLAGEPQYTHFIVPSKSSDARIRGWHITNQESRAFLVTSPEESAAAQLGQTSSEGVVTISYSAAWLPDQPAPSDEPHAGRDGPKRMGMGPPVATKLKEVRRKVGVPRAFLSIYYDRSPAK